MGESRRDKALRYIAEQRVRVVHACEQSICLEIRGSAALPYVVFHGHHAGELVSRCTCPHGADFHVKQPRCAHVAIARLLWRDRASTRPAAQPRLSRQHPSEIRGRHDGPAEPAGTAEPLTCTASEPRGPGCRYAWSGTELREMLRALEALEAGTA
jgi:hypothetical protein